MPVRALLHPSNHPSTYLLAKCQHNSNNNTTDNTKWSTEQKRQTLCFRDIITDLAYT